MVSANVAGWTPEEWEERLERAAEDPEALGVVLAELEQEMRQERTWLHDNPAGGVISTVLEFLGGSTSSSLESLGEQIKGELNAERMLKRRYRTWLPGEKAIDVIFPYIKDFGGDVHRDTGGLQFPGYRKLKGHWQGRHIEAVAFYVSERFPGRDPANFHVVFEPEDGELVIKRVYKMGLPRIDGITTVGRAVLAELASDVVPSLHDVEALVVDNAANRQTRAALIEARPDGDGVSFVLKSDGDAAATPLGHLMKQLVVELGLSPGPFSVSLQPFGVLRIDLAVT